MEKTLQIRNAHHAGSCYGNPLSRSALATKRIFDLALSVIGLLLLSPVYIAFYALIRLEDGGKAIFKQQRVGYRGRIFTLYKFRSMIPQAEPDGNPVLASENDDRLTRIGEFMRAHHLDELPQLYNVLRGDMSFVGYRPERHVFVERIIEANPDYRLLFQMRPGLFSYATLYNGYTDTMEKMLRRLHMDLHYMRTRSLLTDIRIIALTAWSILSGKKF